MSTVAMMAVSSDIPFESEDEIASRLARYEEQFSNRYTEEDDWYAGTCQRTGRWHKVPIMNPWPPTRRGFGKRKRYEDWDGGPYRRGGYHSDRRNRDRGDRGYYSHRDRHNQHEGHSYGRSSGSGHYSRSPRHGHYGSERQGQSPHHSPHGSSWGEQEHHKHPTLSPPSHGHTYHPPPPPVSHTDPDTLYPDDEPPYHSHHEQQSLRSGSRSPGSYPWQPGSGDDPVDQQQWGRSVSPGHDSNKCILMEQQHHEDAHIKGEDGTTTTSSQSGAERDTPSYCEIEPPSNKVKAAPPPPLDLGIGEEEHVVPSQSDVMDILSVASKGANDVTAGNLKQVQRETQMQAARKTMKSRQKHQHGKTTSGKSSIKTASTHSKVHNKGSHKETVLITHGHTKNVSQSRLLEGGTSVKGLSKTHALLQESIAEVAKDALAAPAVSTHQKSRTAAILADYSEGIGGPTPTLGEPSTKAKKGSKIDGKDIATKRKQKRHKIVRPELYSSSENEELDVVTPDSGTASLSVSLRRDFKSESSHSSLFASEQHQAAQMHRRRGSRGKIRLSSEDIASDTGDEAMDIAQSAEPSSLCVKINRNLISPSRKSASLSAEDKVYKPGSHTANMQGQPKEPESSDSLPDSPRYAVEYNPNMSTRVVIRTHSLPQSEVEGQEVLSTDDGKVETVTVASVPKAKKKKKKHKKVTMSDNLKLKISLK